MKKRHHSIKIAVHRAFLTVLCIAGPGSLGFAADPPKLSDEAIRQIETLQAEKASRSPAQKKMDSQLVHAARILRGKAIAGAPKLQPALKVRGDGRVLVDMDATVSDALLERIKAGGGQVIVSVPELKAVRALVSPLLAEELAGRDDVRFVRPAVEATTNAGSVTSEGDVAQKADLIRARRNFDGSRLADGTGVRIGVLSDSVRFLATSQASADLATVTVLSGQNGLDTVNVPPTDTGEGTAMLEIVHDLAPGAQLYFATGGGGPANMAQNIRNLRTNGCDIIIDDLTYANESPFQDGVIAQAVNDVSDLGALYFSAAANSGNVNDGTSGTWEGDFLDGGATAIGNGGRLHNFGANMFDMVTAVGNPTGSNRVNLFWADGLGASGNDYDVYVLDSTGTNVLRQSSNLQDGTQDPYESISTTVTPALNVGDRIVIVKHAGAGRFLHLDTGRGRLAINTAGSTRGHNASAAANAFCVAATPATGAVAAFAGGATNPVETFSSDGPRRVFFYEDGNSITPGNYSSTGGAVLQKPDITAADGVVTTVSGFEVFSGTSAAAPHAGALAALLKSFNPSLTAGQIRTALQGSALDIEAGGFDRDSGVGIVMGFPALQSTLSLDVWVDFSAAAPGFGTFAQPYKTMLRAVSNVREGGNIWIKAPNSTSETISISQGVTIQTVGGAVTIGQ